MGSKMRIVMVVVAVGSLAASAPALASAPARTRTELGFAARSGTHGANHFVLRRAGADLQLLDTDTGAVLRRAAFTRTSRVSIAGADGHVDNTLTLDFSGGSLAVPGGIAYRGGRGGYNALALRGGRFAHEREVARTPHSGLIVLGDTTIHYAEIAPMNDTSVAATFAISGTAAAETINVVNGGMVGGVQTTQVNSSTFESINFGNKTSVTINGAGGGDTFNINNATPATGLSSLIVDSTSAAVTSTFNVAAIGVTLSLVGGGSDIANIGTASAPASSISHPVSVGDPPRFIAVNVNDAANATSSRFVTLTSSAGTDTLSGLTASTVTALATDLASITLSGGSVGNTFVVSHTSTSANPGGTPVTLNSGLGTDSAFVQNVAAGSSVAVHGQGGSDGVSVSNAGSVQGILGAVSVDQAAGSTNLVIDDSSDTTARAISLADDGTTNTIAGIAPASITAKVSHLSNFTLDGGSGGNTVALTGMGAGGPVTLNTGTGADTTDVGPTASLGALNINGEAGNDAVDLGSAGSVQALTGPVAVTNGAASTLTIDDASDTVARAVTVGPTSVTGLAPAPISYPTSVSTLTIDGGGPSDTFAVTPSATTADSLVGGGPASAPAPGNTLTMTLTGATSPVLSGTPSAAGAQGSWTFADRGAVHFSQMLSLNPTLLSIGDAATTVGGSGSAPLLFPATLLAATAQPVSATYASADGSATVAAGAYQPASGTVFFPAGATSETIVVNALGFPTVRPPETLVVALLGPVNASLGRSQATGTITDGFVGATTSPPPPAVAPVVSGLKQTRARWREGKALAVISKRPPVGTSFSFGLNEPASVALAFNRSVGGRKTKGHCVAQTKGNRKSPACKRVVTQGSLGVAGHAGTNRVSFQGRLSPGRALPRARYTLAVTATNAAGQRSRPGALSFTIVK
jgi:hypothetical protein